MWQPWQIVHLTSVSSKNKKAFDNFILSDIRWDLGFYITQTFLKFFPIKGKKQNPFIRREYLNPSSKLQQLSQGGFKCNSGSYQKWHSKKPAKPRQNLPYFCHSDKDAHADYEMFGVLSFDGLFTRLLNSNEAWIRTILSLFRPGSWDETNKCGGRNNQIMKTWNYWKKNNVLTSVHK